MRVGPKNLGKLDILKWLESDKSHDVSYVTNLQMILSSDPSNESLFKMNPKEDTKMINKFLHKFSSIKKLSIKTGQHPTSLKFSASSFSENNIITTLHLDFNNKSMYLDKITSLFTELSKLKKLEHLTLKNLSNIKSDKRLQIKGLGTLKHLKSFRLKNSNVDILESHPTLKRLDLSSSKPHRIPNPKTTLISFPELISFECSIPPIGEIGFSHLKEISRWNEFYFGRILMGSKTLECFRVKHVQGTRHTMLLYFVDEMFKNNVNLKELDISYWNAFNGQLFKYFRTKLKKLRIRGCKNIDFMKFMVSSNSKNLVIPNLVHLDISFCPHFNNKFLLHYSPILRVLEMRGCSDEELIKSEGFRKFRNLRHLDLIYCHQTSMGTEFVQQLFKKNRYLSRIKVNHPKEGVPCIERSMFFDPGTDRLLDPVEFPCRIEVKTKRFDDAEKLVEGHGIDDLLDETEKEEDVYMMDDSRRFLMWDIPQKRAEMSNFFVYCRRCGVNVSEIFSCPCCGKKKCKFCMQHCSRYEECGNGIVICFGCCVKCERCEKGFCKKGCCDVVGKLDYCDECDMFECLECRKNCDGHNKDEDEEINCMNPLYQDD